MREGRLRILELCVVEKKHVMSDPESMYDEAAKFLCIVSSKKTGFKNAFYSQDGDVCQSMFDP